MEGFYKRFGYLNNNTIIQEWNCDLEGLLMWYLHLRLCSVLAQLRAVCCHPSESTDTWCLPVSLQEAGKKQDLRILALGSLDVLSVIIPEKIRVWLQACL